MSDKKSETPKGMICDTCGRTLPPYHFYKHSNIKADRAEAFFTTEKAFTSDHTCFECAGPYRCIRCQIVQPASEFRIQGRICRTCKAYEKTLVLSRQTRTQRDISLTSMAEGENSNALEVSDDDEWESDPFESSGNVVWVDEEDIFARWERDNDE
jgi:hypothetical protein